LLGAALTSNFGWPAIFLVNVPLGLIAIFMALRYLPDVREEQVLPLDIAGFLISSTGLGLLMFGVASAGGHVVSSMVSSILALAGASLLVAYFRRARGRSDALLDASLLHMRTFSIGVIGGALFRTSGGAAAFLLPLLFQVGMGLSIMVSGALSGVYALGALFMRAVGARVIDRFGFKPTLVVGVIATVALTSAFALIKTPDYTLLIPLLAFAGLSQALVYTAVNGLVFADIPEARMSHATGFSSVSQQVAFSCGIAVVAYALQVGGSPSASEQPTLAHFALPFLIISGITSLSLFSFARLRPTDGSALRHREHIVRHHWH
jgi:MFS family permease